MRDSAGITPDFGTDVTCSERAYRSAPNLNSAPRKGPNSATHCGVNVRSDGDSSGARLGGTIGLGEGLEVRRLGFGAMRLAGPGIIGPPADPDEAARVLRRVVEAGVTLIDTADAYGPHHNEELLAEVLAPYPEGLVVATKGGLVRGANGSWDPNGRPDHLRAACEGSLRRLRVDTIDLYQLHRPDPAVPVEDSVGALVELREEGKVRLIGLSNVDLDQYRCAVALTPVASVQNRYNIRDRDHEDVLRACEADGVAFLPYAPLHGFGFTSGTGALADVADAHDATPGQVALAWLLARSPVMAPIPGTSSMAHLEENLAAADLQLSAEELERLDAVDTRVAQLLDKVSKPLPPAARQRLRDAAGPLRRVWERLRFWD